MITIPAINVDGVLRPSEPYPDVYIEVRCDGTTYAVYEPGDEVPPLEPSSPIEPLGGSDD